MRRVHHLCRDAHHTSSKNIISRDFSTRIIQRVVRFNLIRSGLSKTRLESRARLQLVETRNFPLMNALCLLASSSFQECSCSAASPNRERFRLPAAPPSRSSPSTIGASRALCAPFEPNFSARACVR